MTFGGGIRRELWCVFLLVVLGILLFGEVLFSGKTLYGSDFVFQFYPWKKYIYDSLKSRGSLPFWNPYLFSGVPFTG